VNAPVRRFLVIALAIAAAAVTATANYPFVHYANRTGPFVPIPEKFDLNSLPNQTVYFYVSSTGPDTLFSGDTVTAMLTQLRKAGETWNGVGTSALRVAYGGLYAPNTPQNTPYIEVSFSELPPGLLAMGGPTSRADAVKDNDGNPVFVPIMHSVLILNPDLSARPSFSSGFFLTAAHEMGHALGLQHTFTSSLMSTDVTRASTKAAPLGIDDAIGISLLYPNAEFGAGTGSITGAVTLSGDGVNLASVVALAGNAQAVCALTNPDGTFRIDGLPPGDYFVYTHTLPPSVQADLGPSEIVLPVDLDGKPFPAGPSFSTRFYPGTADPKLATVVHVQAGQATAGVNFDVPAQAAAALYGVTTYSFPGQVAVKPAYINLNQPKRSFLLAAGEGLMLNQNPAPGLNVNMIGGGTVIPPNGVHTSYSPYYLEVDFAFTPFSGTGPRHLVFSTGSDIFVLPSAMTLVDQAPPSITDVKGSTDGDGNHVVTITGINLNPATTILFDGVVASTLSVAADQTSVVVTPPPAPSGYAPHVIAMNADGQTSLFLAQPLTYTYDWGPADAPSIGLSIDSLPAGTESMIEVTATNLTFAEGSTTLGFGSSDVVVKRLWMVNPGLLRADVFVARGAVASDTLVTVLSGLQSVSLPGGFHIRNVDPVPVTLSSDLFNAAQDETTVYPGGNAVAPVYNLPPATTADTLTLKLNGTSVPVVSLDGNLLTFTLPEGFPAGPAIMELDTGGAAVSPVFVTIEPAPPVIQAVLDNGTPVDADHPAHVGDPITVLVLHLGDPGAPADPKRIRLNIGGIDEPINDPPQPQADNPKVDAIQTILSPLVTPADQVPVAAWADGRPSKIVNIPVVK